MSSTQPISTTRCPANGSRPVVSVSSTISRMQTLRGGPFGPPARPMQAESRGNSSRITVALAHFMHKPQNVAYLRAGIAELLRAIHDKSARRRFSASGICWARSAASLSSVIPGRGRGRAGAGSRPAPTPRRRRRAPLASGLEQERHVEDDDRCVAGLRLGEELVPRGRDQRMHDGLEPAERGVIPEHHRGELAAIDLAVVGRTRGTRARSTGLLRPHRAHAPRRRHRGPARPPRQRTLPSSICPCRASRSGTARRWAMAHASRHPRRRRKASTGRSGRPRMVKWSPSIRSNSWTPRPSI